MGGAIRIFLASAPERIIEETVLIDSIERRSSRPVHITVINCAEPAVLRDTTTGDETPAPDHWSGKLHGGTAFSFARFCVPELCNYEGRAIYIDCDMLVLGDIAELWDTDLGTAAFAAVPTSAVRGDTPDFVAEGYLTSAMIMDTSRCRSMRLDPLRAAVDEGTITYLDALSLTPAGQAWFGLEVVDLGPEWNDLERCFPDTELLHFTDGQRQPWLHPGHPAQSVWRRDFLSCVRRGVIDAERLDTAYQRRGISRRTRRLADVPGPLAPVADAAAQRLELAKRRRRISG